MNTMFHRFFNYSQLSLLGFLLVYAFPSSHCVSLSNTSSLVSQSKSNQATSLFFEVHLTSTYFHIHGMLKKSDFP